MAATSPAPLPDIPEPRFDVAIWSNQYIGITDEMPRENVLHLNAPSSINDVNFVAMGFCSLAELIPHENGSSRDDHPLPDVVLGVCKDLPNEIHALIAVPNMPGRCAAVQTHLKVDSKEIQHLRFYDLVVHELREAKYPDWQMVHEFAQFLLSPELETGRFDDEVEKYYEGKSRLPSLLSARVGTLPAGARGDGLVRFRFLSVIRAFRKERSYFNGVSGIPGLDTNEKFENDLLLDPRLDGEGPKLPDGQLYRVGHSHEDMVELRNALIRAVNALNALLN